MIDEVEQVIRKTPSELFDSLCTTIVKCYMFQDYQLAATTPEEKAAWGEKVLELNRKRNLLMRAIDRELGFSPGVTSKSYLNDKPENLEPEF